MAINRIRAWYDRNRERCPYDEGELGRKVLSNLVGFDLNPLAVMAARTNYLIAIRDLVGYSDAVEIPVYLCDAILTPSEYGGLFAGGLGDVKELKLPQGCKRSATSPPMYPVYDYQSLILKTTLIVKSPAYLRRVTTAPIRMVLLKI
jgi:hypothetical protein